jgi:hypothetical protein
LLNENFECCANYEKREEKIKKPQAVRYKSSTSLVNKRLTIGAFLTPNKQEINSTKEHIFSI